MKDHFLVKLRADIKMSLVVYFSSFLSGVTNILICSAKYRIGHMSTECDEHGVC